MPRLIRQLLALAISAMLVASALAQSSGDMMELPPPNVALDALAQEVTVSDNEIDLPSPFPAVIPYSEMKAENRAPAPPSGCHVGGGIYIPSSPQGCGSLRFEAVARVLFIHDDVALDDSAQHKLTQAAEQLRDQTDVQRVLIRGHTDEVGQVEYNEGLADQRALAVRDYLAALGVQPDWLHLHGHGEHAPQDENWTRLGRARNRWVEVYVVHALPPPAPTPTQ